jgi:hypothetical protein
MYLRNTTDDVRIWSPEEIGRSEDVPAPLKIVMGWVNSYIIKPHHELGRTGVVCPYVPPSLKMNSLWLAVAQDIPHSETEMCAIVDIYKELYQSLEPCTSKAKELKTLILIFPDITHQEAHSLIGGVHSAMKPSIVESGLMLGEFYAENESPGLYNSQFRPLRSPIPLLIYRQLVPNDLVFLTKPSDPPERRVQFILAYLRFMGDKLPPERICDAQTALAAAQLQVRMKAEAKTEE